MGTVSKLCVRWGAGRFCEICVECSRDILKENYEGTCSTGNVFTLARDSFTNSLER
jgi:hypothetical protein